MANSKHTKLQLRIIIIFNANKFCSTIVNCWGGGEEEGEEAGEVGEVGKRKGRRKGRRRGRLGRWQGRLGRWQGRLKVSN